MRLLITAKNVTVATAITIGEPYAAMLLQGDRELGDLAITTCHDVIHLFDDTQPIEVPESQSVRTVAATTNTNGATAQTCSPTSG